MNKQEPNILLFAHMASVSKHVPGGVSEVI